MQRKPHALVGQTGWIDSRRRHWGFHYGGELQWEGRADNAHDARYKGWMGLSRRTKSSAITSINDGNLMPRAYLYVMRRRSMNKARDPNKLSPACIALVGLFTVHTSMIAAVNLGLELTHAEQDAWMAGVLVPMFVAWLTVTIEVFTRTY
jgi:hypothetical protein